MTPEQLLSHAIDPALRLLPVHMDSLDARRMMLAICIQESNLKHRRQVIKRSNGTLSPTGPAMGFPQFERWGGVKGVLTHRATRGHARALCQDLVYPLSGNLQADTSMVWNAMQHNDVLAMGMTRLNLWWHPGAMPTEQAPGWGYYIDTWRPGKPYHRKWPRSWRLAHEAVFGD